MPCFSTVTKTKMTKHPQLSDALKADGWAVVVDTENEITATMGVTTVSFTRRRNTDAFETTWTKTDSIQRIQRKYAELGVREFAKRKGFSIASVSADKRKFELINRSRG